MSVKCCSQVKFYSKRSQCLWYTSHGCSVLNWQAEQPQRCLCGSLGEHINIWPFTENVSQPPLQYTDQMSLCWTAKRNVLSEEDMTSRASCEQKLRAVFYTKCTRVYRRNTFYQKPKKWRKLIFVSPRSRERGRTWDWVGKEIGEELRGAGKQGENVIKNLSHGILKEQIKINIDIFIN